MKHILTVVAAENFHAAAKLLSDNNKNKLMAMFGSDESQIGGKMSIYAVFAAVNQGGPLQLLKTEFGEHERTYAALTPIIPAANWYERELKDMFGLVALGHPDLRPLVLHEKYPQNIHPLTKNFGKTTVLPLENHPSTCPRVEGEGVFEVPVGPIHAGIIEPGHFVFSQVGETVLNLEAKLFFTHRGLEKAFEGQTIEKALFMAERTCGACSVSHALSFCQAIESLSTAVITTKAQALRVLFAELERLYNHVGDFGNISAGLAFAPIISNGARLKERLMRINERLTGNRWLRGMVIPGGVRQDVDAELLLRTILELEEIASQVERLGVSMYDQHEFVNRVSKTGVVPRELAEKLCFTGIAGRACGVAEDARVQMPYELYDRLDFDIITRTSGDVDARIRVRMGEIAESLKIIKQLPRILIDHASEGLSVPLGFLMSGIPALGVSESARGNNLHAVILNERQEIERLFIRSASYSNWPALPIATPGNIIPDFPLINKSFELCYACLDR